MEPKLSRDAYIQVMRQRVEDMLGKIADAVNEAAPGRSSPAVRRRSATCSRASDKRPSSKPCRCGWMRRKPLFPPPKDPKTQKSKHNKGRQDYTVLTVNGRVRLWRRRWYSAGEGTTTPVDAWVDAVEATISLGVREMACRLNGDGKNFDKAAANLVRAPRYKSAARPFACWSRPKASGSCRCRSRDGCRSTGRRWIAGWSRARLCVYFGSDGVMVPLVTEVEKKGRRQKSKEKRQRRGRKARPLPARKGGADQKYKEFKIVAYYDETQADRLVSGTRGDHEAAGRLMRREAGRIRLDLADEKVGNVDGSPWIRNQAERQSLPLDALGLDFYHLGENVHKARREIYGEEDETGKQWAGTLLHTFKHQGYQGAWEQLLPWRVGLRRGQRAAADRLLNYVSERRQMIRYPEFVANGWQIGSGPTEATCKTLTARFEGSGMR